MLRNCCNVYCKKVSSFSYNLSLEVNGCSKPYKHPRQVISPGVCFCTNSGSKCWKCGTTVRTLFCDNCKTLQKLNKNKNYFDLLEIKMDYDLKTSDLTQKYRKLQSVLHPDKFGNKEQDERDISEEYSSAVNKAYSTLNHPVERGLYMLRLNGSDVEEDAIQLDPKFLMEIMEINEEIENEMDSSKISEYNKINKEQISSLIQELSLAFKKKDLSTAKEILSKLKYFTNIDNKIKDIKLSLGLSN